ncbi:UDP-N-acetylglucosamine-dolichyl-phosphate N-acetylglucosaminephosphotransferase [Smittium culicis]|uniref:UDP-N-acetylglucosamine-dolichyl-phosphate N-acetylglucosaminephosphotransferase n=2 Tax=Smittium culicis TaxID=133412 RepID=A0A1R1XQG8_9FUNG|nr:UDP-N-acetylglucosamine-dolichyl-phosphate N-acetylglucosaminephosphotransferase [Smittium culicis]
MPQLFRLVPCPRHRMPSFTRLVYKSNDGYVQIENHSSSEKPNFYSFSKSIDKVHPDNSSGTRPRKSSKNKKNKLRAALLNANDYTSSNTENISSFVHTNEYSSQSSNYSSSENLNLNINTNVLDNKLNEIKLAASENKKLQRKKVINSPTISSSNEGGLKHDSAVEPKFLENVAKNYVSTSKTGVLIPSKTSLDGCTKLGFKIISFLELFKLVKVWRDPKTSKMTHVNNLTILNLYLVWFGPTSEKKLTYYIMLTQVLFSFLAFFIRYTMSSIFYDDVFK